MFYPKKLQRAMDWQREQNQKNEHEDNPDGDLPDMEELRKEQEQIKLEKGDLPAMIFSAFLVFIPVAVIVMLLFCAIAFLFV